MPQDGLKSSRLQTSTRRYVNLHCHWYRTVASLAGASAVRGGMQEEYAGIGDNLATMY